MSTEEDNLFEQELPLYKESPKPLILKKETETSEADTTEEPVDQNRPQLTIKNVAVKESHSDLIIHSESPTPASGLKIKSSGSSTNGPSLLIKKTRTEAPELEHNPEFKSLSNEQARPERPTQNEDLDETTTSSSSLNQDEPVNSMDGELFSGAKPKTMGIQSPHNSDSIKQLESNDPVPEPGIHSPQTIILRNKPLPQDKGKLSLTSVELPPEEEEDRPSFNTSPPPHIHELEEYEEVLNTAAQESVFELTNTELEHEEETTESQQEELFDEIHSEVEEPRHLKNSPTIYEMEDDSSIGTMLMSARQKASYTIKELARRTNIKEAYIIALEEENRSNLPDPIYTKSYIKNLCHELNIEYHKALKLYANLCGEEFDTQYNIAQKGPDKYASKPASSSLQKWSAIFVIFLILGLIGVGFTAKHFYSPIPVFKSDEQVNLNNFHQEITIPIPRLKVPNK
ncbi:helix-turn-helix domain-containing protein [Lentisphaera marina]|uniref:helix-turn-helix domain-containing protein n=1 Tax=Lentisphaera marina TaxID=1111041 RepID=UPI002366B00A|nr:helix-turn-helix domain-containing protein [Lentisphaera marina]MDD7984223.1 helix-turn-helix domain-containing protein [Lentisphaera marina]